MLHISERMVQIGSPKSLNKDWKSLFYSNPVSASLREKRSFAIRTFLISHLHLNGKDSNTCLLVTSSTTDHCLLSQERRWMHDLSCCQQNKRDKWLKLHWTLAVSKMAGKMIWAAGLSLLLAKHMQLSLGGNQDLFHRNLKERSKCVQVIYSGKAFTFLPLIDCSGFLKTEVVLQVSNGHATLHAQATDVISRGHKVNHRKCFHRHRKRLLHACDTIE